MYMSKGAFTVAAFDASFYIIWWVIALNLSTATLLIDIAVALDLFFMWVVYCSWSRENLNVAWIVQSIETFVFVLAAVGLHSTVLACWCVAFCAYATDC